MNTAVMLLALHSAVAGAAEYEDLSIKELLAHSEVAAVVTMNRPSWSSTSIPISDAHPGCGTYPLAKYHFTVLEVLKGFGVSAPTGVTAAVNAHARQTIKLSLETCLTGVRQPAPVYKRYPYSGLSPNSGDTLIVFLNRNEQWGWELAAADAFVPKNQAGKLRSWALRGK